MSKTALATQVPKDLKDELDALCEERGLTISRIIEDALREKIDDLREEEILLEMALKRFSEPDECSHTEFKNVLSHHK